MDDGHREKICHDCCDAEAVHIVITHGSDTATKTAEALAGYSHGLKGKTIVITGSSTPFMMKDTNADFNLGMASAVVRILPPGIYIAMSGMVYPWNACVKNEDGLFVDNGAEADIGQLFAAAAAAADKAEAFIDECGDALRAADGSGTLVSQAHGIASPS